MRREVISPERSEEKTQAHVGSRVGIESSESGGLPTSRRFLATLRYPVEIAPRMPALKNEQCRYLHRDHRLVPCQSSKHHLLLFLFMSWHYSQALVAASLGENSSDGEPSAPSNGTPTHGMFWSPDKTTDASRPSRSGMTFRPSTGSHGEDVLTWCLEASPVRTSPPPVKAQGSKASEAVCGNTWSESGVKFDQESSSWKTHRCLWEEVLPSSSLTLPRWGMMRAGVLWERITQPLLTNEIESGSWLPTPLSTLGSNGGPNARDSSGRPGLQMAAMTWPTPTASMVTTADQEQARYAGNKGGNRPSYQEAKARTWPTPKAADATGGGQHNCPVGQMHLRDAVKQGLPGGQLNPTWVEWLMGWPLGWTDCAASATAKFREWCRSHGIS